MKILIVSDTHGNCKHLELVLEKHRDIELLIHLGDLCGDLDYIEAISPCKTVIVSGNNDYFLNIDREKLFFVSGHQIFVTHGHYYGVHYGIEDIIARGKELGASIVMYGHTHIPRIDKKDSIYCINPGSLSLPRQEDKKPTYIIMDIDDKNSVDFHLHYAL